MLQKPRIVVIGGGAGGLELVTTLGRRLGKKGKARITLVDKYLTHIWKPLLHEVAVGTLDSHEDQIDYVTHAYANYFKFQLGELVGVDRQQQRVFLQYHYQDQIYKQSLDYDILVIAIGSVANDYGIPGVSQYCISLDTQADANRFHDLFLRQLMGINAQSASQQHQLDTVIIGGGATGVELAAEMRIALQQAAAYGLQNVKKMPDIKISIVEGAPRILAALPERISATTMQELRHLKVDVYVGQRVTDVTEVGVKLASGQFIPAMLKVWAAGIQGPPVLAQCDGLELAASHQLKVLPTLQTTRDKKIFAFGDCAACPRGVGEQLVPARAQAAHQQASLLARSIYRIINHKLPLQYHYKDYGSLVSLSRQGSVGQFMGKMLRSVMVEGWLARMFYLSLHKMHQIKLQGWWHTMITTVAHLISRRYKPKLKLH